MAFEQVELASVPFLHFVANKGPKAKPPIILSYCAAMCATGFGNVWAEYDRIKLNDIVAAGGAASGSPRVQVVGRKRPNKSVLPRPCLRPRKAGPGRAGRSIKSEWNDCRDGGADAAVHRRIAAPAGRQDAARAAVDRVFRTSDRPIIGYDLNPASRRWRAAFPTWLSTVDIADTLGQMALFDG